jgi:hypothetical protein
LLTRRAPVSEAMRDVIERRRVALEKEARK